MMFFLKTGNFFLKKWPKKMFFFLTLIMDK